MATKRKPRPSKLAAPKNPMPSNPADFLLSEARLLTSTASSATLKQTPAAAALLRVAKVAVAEATKLANG